MNVKQFTGLISTSFEAIGIDPETEEEVKGTINIKLNRLAFKTVTQEGFAAAMENADKDPTVIGNLLAGTEGKPGLLAWWEMFEDDANTEMLPITCENIITLPYEFVAALAEAVMNKLFPGPAIAGSSLAGSARRGNMSLAAIEPLAETQMISDGDTTSQEAAVSGA